MSDGCGTALTGDGIDPSGAYDSTDAIQAILDTNTDVYCPPGTYLVNDLALTGTRKLYGGPGAVFQLTATGTKVLTVSGYGAIIEGITFHGNVADGAGTGLTSVGTQYGLEISGAENTTVRDCNFYSFSGAGLHALSCGNTSTGGRINGGANHIFGGYAQNCYYGAWFDTRAEYFTVTGLVCVLNRFGAKNQGGNNMFNGCMFNTNMLGFWLTNDTNSGHGGANGCSFNHNTTYAAQLDENLNGFTFNGCQFFSGTMLLNKAKGIVMGGCQFGTMVIRAGGGDACRIYDSVWIGACSVVHAYGGMGLDKLVLTNVLSLTGAALT